MRRTHLAITRLLSISNTGESFHVFPGRVQPGAQFASRCADCRSHGGFHRIAGHVGDRAVADLIRGFGRFAGDRLTPGPAFDGVQKRTIIPVAQDMA